MLAPTNIFNLVSTTPSAYSISSSVKVKDAGGWILKGLGKLVDGVLDSSQDRQFVKVLKEFHAGTDKNTFDITTNFKALIKENPTPTIKELRKVLQMGNTKYDDVAEFMQRTGLLAMVDSKSGKLVLNNPKKLLKNIFWNMTCILIKKVIIK